MYIIQRLLNVCMFVVDTEASKNHTGTYAL